MNKKLDRSKECATKAKWDVCVWQKKGGDSGNLYIHARYSIISFLALSLLLCNAEIFMSWKKNQQNDRCALIPTK